MDGIYAIYKPKGPSSYDILRRLKALTGVNRIGHAGTLDPLASGVLVVGVGREATKRLSEIVKKEKEYLATLRLGQTSRTDDEEGERQTITVSKKTTKREIETVLKSFKGQILQTPPQFSAVKVSGRPAYKLARVGKKVKLKKRRVEIKAIKLLHYKWPDVKLRIVTGPGVYIRSLARDIGRALGTGGYLAELERVRVGQYSKKKAVNLDEPSVRW